MKHAAMMETLKRWLLAIGMMACLTALHPSVFASHLGGASLTYSCVNACTVRVHITLLRNCHGSNFLNFNSLTWTGAPGCVIPVPIGNFSPQITTNITPICPGTPTLCDTSSALIGGVETFEVDRDYDICQSAPCNFVISWTDCCRTPSITSLAVPGSEGLWVSAEVNTAITPCNNSPKVLGPPVVYFTVGQDHDFSFSASDPDGDSLAFSLGDCKYSATGTITYNSNYSGTQPFGGSWNVSINPRTGLVHLAANPGYIETGVVCVYVNEYRNGVQIGRIQQDVNVVVVPNQLGNSQPAVGSIVNPSPNAIVLGDEVYVCSATPVCFDISGSDNDLSQNLVLTWSRNLPGATFTSTANILVHDTIPGTGAVPPAGRFCWTPPSNGHYFVRFSMVDDECPLLGVGERVIALHVGQGPASANATALTCPDVQFSAAGCGAGPFTYLWTGAGGLSSSAQNPVHTYAGPGSYPWQVIVSNGWRTDTIVDTIVVGGGTDHLSFLSGIHYVSPCTGTLYDTLDAGSWLSYQWSNGDTTQQTVVFLGGTYHVTVSSPNGCAYSDSTSLFWSSPDIYGVVHTSTGAPLQNQKIMLVEHDTTLQALWARDSTWTDSLGYYYFCNVTDTLVFLKALPAQSDYPNEMPTYADTTLFWNHAVTFHPLLQSPFQHDFATLFGINPGGPGFIGGLITQGANKVNAIGDPVPGLRVFLRDAGSGDVLGSRVTNSNGYFSFANVPLGDYEIVPDRPLVSTTNVPMVTLTAQTPVMDSLDFQLHRYWLELVAPATEVAPATSGMEIQVVPNPFAGSFHLQLRLEQATEVEVAVWDVMGRQVETVFAGELKPGAHRFSAGQSLKAGVYFLRMRQDGKMKTVKLTKSSAN